MKKKKGKKKKKKSAKGSGDKLIRVMEKQTELIMATIFTGAVAGIQHQAGAGAAASGVHPGGPGAALAAHGEAERVPRKHPSYRTSWKTIRSRSSTKPRTCSSPEDPSSDSDEITDSFMRGAASRAASFSNMGASSSSGARRNAPPSTREPMGWRAEIRRAIGTASRTQPSDSRDYVSRRLVVRVCKGKNRKFFRAIFICASR